MDQIGLQTYLEGVPKLNPRIVKGIATEQMRQAVHTIDSAISSIIPSFPEGLKYVGYKVCDPKTTFLELTKQRDGNRRRVELSRSDFFLVRYDFTYDDGHGPVKLRPCYFCLPFTDDQTPIMFIRGKRYSISPVLSDPAFSIGTDYVFVPLNKKRANFERTYQHFYLNGVMQTTYVVWAWLHANAKRRTGTKNVIYSTIAHYLFARYGLTETFKQFAACDVVVGYEEINHTNYPAEEWFICQSACIPPKSAKTIDYKPFKKGTYETSKLRIAIPVSQYSQMAISLIGGFFYIVDRFPQKVEAAFVDNTDLWMLLLGVVINGPGASIGLLINEVKNHLQSLDEYVDPIDKKNFEMAGLMNCEDVYQLFAHIVELLSHQQMNRDRRLSNLIGKHLVTQRYALFDVIKQINYLNFALRNAQHKKQRLDEMELNNILQKWFKPTTAFKMTNGHGEITPISTASDNLYVGVTSSMVSQENADPHSGEKSRITLNNPARHLDSSLPVVATYNAMRKSDPTGLDVISPYVGVSDDGRILPCTKYEALLERVQREIWT